MMPEVRELLICMVMVIAEQDIIQLILFDFFFQPMNISGKILAFQSDFDTDLIPEELPGYVESLRSLREKYRDQISHIIGVILPRSVV